MLKGFTYNNQHSSSLGIYSRIGDMDIFPEIGDIFKENPSRDGSYLMPGKLKDKRLPVICFHRENNIEDVRAKQFDISAWLYTQDWSELSLDVIENKFFIAKLIGPVSSKAIITTDEFTLNFRRHPLAFSAEISESFVNDVIIVNNIGNYPALPRFEVTFTDSASEWKVSNAAGQYVRVIDTFILGDELAVDFSTGRVMKNGIVVMGKLNWQYSRFFSLGLGDNALTVTPEDVCSTQIKFNPCYV
ncbi:phage tail domain-containing protein [Bacteroides sp.]|uniref:phage distal tail protein n=1 Tax=Bacteroides sp. TaxID=29523 RepID=UPI00262D58C1|nr:phage tail domain-containing protein [Bacteroides sp.]MDD3040773.1 phage tail family protein [Bacteroides sp.]